MYLKKYWTLLKLNIANSLEYRAALFVWILIEIISLSSAVFLWLAIFRTNQNVAGYNFSQIITYYLLVPIVGGFTSIFVSEHLPRQIKDGEISHQLMKPFSIAFAQLINQFSMKLTQLTFKIPIYTTVAIIFSLLFKVSLGWNFLLLALIVCIFSYLLNFAIDLTISYAAFWFDDAWSLSHFKNIIMMVFGGLSFPLDLLPLNVQKVFTFLPFRFVYFFPVKVATGGITQGYFYSEFSKLLIWLILLLLFAKFLWSRGIKKYSAYGN